jgi:Cu/Ag efflux protein CusF
MRRSVFAGAVAAALAAASASAQTAPPAAAAPAVQRIKGTIDAFDPVARSLSVTSGKTAKIVTLPANLRIVYNQRRKVADIKQGDFIGAAALKAADGKLRAQQVAVFPEDLRGMGEGQYPMGEAASNRIMTNATVAGVTAAAPNNGTLKVTYRGAAAAADGSCGGHASASSGAGCTGDAEIVIAPGIPVIGLMLGDETLLVPGAAVSLIATTTPEGTLQATRLTVEKDGVKPIL